MATSKTPRLRAQKLLTASVGESMAGVDDSVEGAANASQKKDQSVEIYDTSDLHAVIRALSGAESEAGFVWTDQEDHLSSEDSIRLKTLNRIAADPRGAKRDLVMADKGISELLDDLRAIAPHFEEFIALVERCSALALMTGKPQKIPPVLLVGPPGVGKTFLLKRLTASLGLEAHIVPCANFDAFRWRGLNTAWRGARRGKVAEILLDGKTANPLVVLDEFDKMPLVNLADRPYDAALDLLEPENARSHRDDYLEFSFRADLISWVGSANDLSSIPAPVLDRLTIINVREPTHDERGTIVRSVYREICATYGGVLCPELPDDVVRFVSHHSARNSRKILECALGFAARTGRCGLLPEDVGHAHDLLAGTAKPRMGFL